MPIDPVCGIELEESLAVSHDYNGKKIFFVVMDAEKFS